jgi:cytochrome c oxidase subunit 3
MAMAVTFAQQNRQGLLKLCLALTLAGAFGFLGIKYIEYSHKFEMGIFPGMPLYLNDAVREEAKAAGHIETSLTAAAAPATAPAAAPAAATVTTSGPFTIPEVEAPTVVKPATAPGGLNMAVLDEHDAEVGHHVAEPDKAAHEEHAAHDEHAHGPPHPVFRDTRPESAHMFFNIYFFMTGLHGIHVIVGVIVISWLLLRAMKGEFNDQYFTPVDLGGLYWHLVDLIWIFLFPMFYLI